MTSEPAVDTSPGNSDAGTLNAGNLNAAGELIVVSGPPGAGKSTISALLAEHFDPSVLVAGDEFFGFLCSGRVDPWLAESERQNTTVIAAAAAACGAYVKGGYTVVYDGVVGPWFVDHFLSQTGLLRLHYALLLPGEEACVERVGRRQGHPFSDPDATRHMCRQFSASARASHCFAGVDGPEALVGRILRALSERGIAYPIGSDS